jgi:hypothetical protein
VNREAEAFSWFQDVLLKLEAKREADPAFARFLQIRVFLSSFQARADFGSQLLKARARALVCTSHARRTAAGPHACTVPPRASRALRSWP